jgi:hypothetical protein
MPTRQLCKMPVGRLLGGLDPGSRESHPICGRLIRPRIFIPDTTLNHLKSAQIATKTGHIRSEQPDRNRNEADF